MRVWHRRPPLSSGWRLYASTGTVDGIGPWQTARQSQPVSLQAGRRRPGRGSSCRTSGRLAVNWAPPEAHGRLINPYVGGDLLVRTALRAGQHDLRAQRQILGGLRPPGLPTAPAGPVRPPPAPARLSGARSAPRPPARSAFRGELTPPLRHRPDRHPQFPGSIRVGDPLRARQDDPGLVSPPPSRQPCPAQQLSPLIFRQHDLDGRRTGIRVAAG
jgi:hypothetical protein